MNIFDFIRGRPRAPERIGLALGGGAVRGAAHLGVLSVLEREGIPISVVAGTSVGAIVGAGVAAGVPVAEMWAEFHRASWTRIAFPSWGSRLGLLDSDPLGKLIERVTGIALIEELTLPYAAIACDILTGERVILESGPLREAVIASSAIPGLFEPVRRDDRLLVDGGLVDNLPVDTARELGADYVIAVDIMPALDGTYVPRDMRDMIMLGWNIVQSESEFGREKADLVITPGVAAISLSDFSRAADAYQAGIDAAEAALPALRTATLPVRVPRNRIEEVNDDAG